MSVPRSGLLAVTAVVLLLAACDQNTTQTQETPTPEAPPAAVAEVAPVEPAPAPAPEPIPALTELAVNSVDSVMLSRPQDAPSALVIRVLGTAASGGWTLPKLEPMIQEGADASILAYRLVATSPEVNDGAGSGSAQLEAELRVDALPTDVMTIRIVSATNEVSAPVAQ